MTIYLHEGDLPSDVNLGQLVAIDTETMGLDLNRDRLCLVQLSAGDGTAHLVKFKPGQYHCPHLKKLLEDPKITKLFHFARFDVGMLNHHLNIKTSPIYCTKIASKLVRTYTDKHGLKELCKEFLNIDLSKQQQSSDWGHDILTKEQQTYAASDVLHLHAIKEKLDVMLKRENRLEMAQACFDFLPTRAALDLAGWNNLDLFSHS